MTACHAAGLIALRLCFFQGRRRLRNCLFCFWYACLRHFDEE
ncbi:hypothetical protein B4114_1919 [Geobacillus stearothermophilus]|uniref:Uncharacterized protein n=1 Tax=Geobacillus stearothermophilus TaxID=1422 RepID=A0A150NCI9_GEOSE|nr:hypothetical protein B4114_1919 [Geobacillus stearothermophilus]